MPYTVAYRLKGVQADTTVALADRQAVEAWCVETHADLVYAEVYDNATGLTVARKLLGDGGLMPLRGSAWDDGNGPAISPATLSVG